MPSKGTINRAQLEYAVAHAPAGTDPADIADSFVRKGYVVEGYQPALAVAAPGGSAEASMQSEDRMLAGPLALGAGVAAVRAGKALLDRSRTVGALLTHGKEELLADKGPAGAAARIVKRVAEARSAPRTSPHLQDLGQSITQIPEHQLPAVQPFQPPALSLVEGGAGGPYRNAFQIAEEANAQGPILPSESAAPGRVLETPEGLVAEASGVPVRSITVGGKQAYAPRPTKEPRYTGGRGKSRPKLAETQRQLEQVGRGESVTSAAPGPQPRSGQSQFQAAIETSREGELAPRGAKQVQFGKNGHVIGEIGDEARVAGRAADTVEELIAKAAAIARKVPKSAREAVFKTVKAASKFANEADTALGGPAMVLMQLLPKSVLDEAVNTHFTIDPQTGKIVKRVVDVGA